MSNARQVVTRSPHRTVGRINRCSHFQKSPIDYESQLEKQFVLLAMLCPAVVEIKHQPFTLKLDNPAYKKYTPDFLVTLEDGSFAVVEIKPNSKIAKETRRFDVVCAELTQKNLPFLVITDQEIEQGKRHKQAESILRYVNWNIADEVRAAALGFIRTAAHSSLSALMEASQASVEDLMHLVARRQLVPSDLAMSPLTLIQLPNCETHHGILQFSGWFNAQIWHTPV